jgi:hypothetical protein
VAGSDEMRLRYVHDEASGDVIKVPIPPAMTNMRVFGRTTKCAVLDGHVEKTNFSTWTPKGSYDDGKAHVTGDATFSHCAVPSK